MSVIARTKYSFEEVQLEFDSRGYDLVSTEYHNPTEKLQYICRKHRDKGIQEITFTKFHHYGQGCKYCGRERTIEGRKAKINKEEDKALCESHNFQYVDTYVQNHEVLISFICNNHVDLGVQTMKRTNMKRQIKGCKYCSGKQLPEWYIVEQAHKINPYVKWLEPYVNLTTRMKCVCTRHNIYSNKTMQEILAGKGCKICGAEKLAEKRKLTLEEFQARISIKNPNIKVLNYITQKEQGYFQCTKCGHKWASNAANMINNSAQCPKCDILFEGERIIANLLDCWKYKYIRQHKFSDCKDLRPLPFDFYLPNYNTCIEYDGIYHFKDIYGTTDSVQRHDRIKNNYCKNNGIKLIRINYLAEDIEYELFDKMVLNGLIEEINLNQYPQAL